jgi:hypothetical protein
MKFTHILHVIVIIAIITITSCNSGCINLTPNIELHIASTSPTVKTILIMEKHTRDRRGGWMGIGLQLPKSNTLSLLSTGAKRGILPIRISDRLFSPQNMSVIQWSDNQFEAQYVKRGLFQNVYHVECFSFLGHSCVYAFNLEHPESWKNVSFVFYRNYNQTVSPKSKTGASVFKYPSITEYGTLDFTYKSNQCQRANVTDSSFTGYFYENIKANSLIITVISGIAACILTCQFVVTILLHGRLLIKSRMFTPYICSVFSIIGRISSFIIHLVILIAIGRRAELFSYSIFFSRTLIVFSYLMMLLEYTASTSSAVIYGGTFYFIAV